MSINIELQKKLDTELDGILFKHYRKMSEIKEKYEAYLQHANKQMANFVMQRELVDEQKYLFHWNYAIN